MENTGGCHAAREPNGSFPIIREEPFQEMVLKVIPIFAAAFVALCAVPAQAAMTDWHKIIGTWADTTDGACRITMNPNGSIVAEHCSRWNFASFNRPYSDETEFVARDGTQCRATLIIPVGNRVMIQTPCGTFTLTRSQ
jgi:hypothetical protein